MTSAMRVALEELLHYYKEGRDPKSHNTVCPLCEVVGINKGQRNCEECQWTKEGFFADNQHAPCITWRSKHFDGFSFYTIQSNPRRRKELADKRIEMIEQWLINDK